MARKEGKSIPRDPNWIPEPHHPGWLVQEIIDDGGLSIEEFSLASNIDETELKAVLAAEIGISKDLAGKIGAFCGYGSDLLLKLQSSYDGYRT